MTTPNPPSSRLVPPGRDVAGRCDDQPQAPLHAAGGQPPESPALSDGPPWLPSLPADGSGGVPHFRPGTRDECGYLAMVGCNKCGWADDDPERVATAAARLSRVLSGDPLCGCGERESQHDREGRGGCTLMTGAGTCPCAKFSAAGAALTEAAGGAW